MEDWEIGRGEGWKDGRVEDWERERFYASAQEECHVTLEINLV